MHVTFTLHLLLWWQRPEMDEFGGEEHPQDELLEASSTRHRNLKLVLMLHHQCCLQQGLWSSLLSIAMIDADVGVSLRWNSSEINQEEHAGVVVFPEWQQNTKIVSCEDGPIYPLYWDQNNNEENICFILISNGKNKNLQWGDLVHLPCFLQ